MKLQAMVLMLVTTFASAAEARIAGLRITNLSATPGEASETFDVAFDVEILSPAGDTCLGHCDAIGEWFWISTTNAGTTWQAIEPRMPALEFNDGTARATWGPASTPSSAARTRGAP